MAISLQEQLLKAGLVKEKQLKKSKSDKRKKVRQQLHSKEGVVDESKEAAKRALAEKAQRDRELAQQRNQQAEAKAIAAQVRQIITMNKQEKNNGELAYKFVDNKIIKSIYVDQKTLDHLSNGQLAIVSLDQNYEIVPQTAALKIQQRDPDCVIVCNEKHSNDDTQEDDPYADFKVPDDLMW
ncbi:MAG: DUF2058 domain-containing protein [Pseudohongiellaceae bacterium]|nr:DUF2058 domain-containing protein [Pseudohongiellaceae bacterium]